MGMRRSQGLKRRMDRRFQRPGEKEREEVEKKRRK
jgi:hypothetical protein